MLNYVIKIVENFLGIVGIWNEVFCLIARYTVERLTQPKRIHDLACEIYMNINLYGRHSWIAVDLYVF